MTLTDKAAELHDRGFCVLKGHFASGPIEACRVAFEPRLEDYLRSHAGAPNRGPCRHFIPMSFHPPCFASEFFFDDRVLGLVRSALGERIVADQWGCDIPLAGSNYQELHADYQRPLFEELPELQLPTYMIVVSFPLTRIAAEDGPIEIAPGTHRIPRGEGLSQTPLEPVLLEPGDVLVRHPWTLHRGTPNRTARPRLLCTIRYTRRWDWDSSREVSTIPDEVWLSLTPSQREMMRFPYSS